MCLSPEMGNSLVPQWGSRKPTLLEYSEGGGLVRDAGESAGACVTGYIMDCCYAGRDCKPLKYFKKGYERIIYSFKELTRVDW